MTLSEPLQEVMAARVAVSLALNLLRFGVAVLLLSVAVLRWRYKPGMQYVSITDSVYQIKVVNVLKAAASKLHSLRMLAVQPHP